MFDRVGQKFIDARHDGSELCPVVTGSNTQAGIERIHGGLVTNNNHHNINKRKSKGARTIPKNTDKQGLTIR